MAKGKYVEAMQADIAGILRKGNPKGLSTAFNTLDDLYSVLLSSWTVLFGAPYCGKSELLFELLMNLSNKHGLRHVVFTPETGTPGQVYAELISKKLRKPVYRDVPGAATEAEILNAVPWIHEHFVVVDAEEDPLSVADFLSQVDKVQEDRGQTFHTFSIDPWNELTHPLSDYGGREDRYLEEKLRDIRVHCRKRNRHGFITVHVQNQLKITDSSGSYYPPPSPREIAGGQAWFRRADSMISVWRPPFREGDDESKRNEAQLSIEKAKPKGIGQKGTVSLFYDYKQNRYYEAGGRYAD